MVTEMWCGIGHYYIHKTGVGGGINETYIILFQK